MHIYWEVYRTRIHPVEPLFEGSKNPSRFLIQRAMILLMGPARLWMEGCMGGFAFHPFYKGDVYVLCVLCERRFRDLGSCLVSILIAFREGFWMIRSRDRQLEFC